MYKQILEKATYQKKKIQATNVIMEEEEKHEED
jgi:hypothetical protein